MDANINSTTHGPSAALQWWMPSSAGGNGSSAFAATLERAKRAARAKRAQRGASRRSASAFEGPPPEVEREMDAAASASRILAEQGQELRFGRDPDGRVSVELTDTSGRALYAIGPSELFRLLGGGD
jgi:hypothetical protein